MPQPLLLTAFEFNTSNARSRRKGRLYFLSAADISRIPTRYIQHIEIDDADRDVVGTLLEDTLDRGRLCGERALHVAAFLRAVQASG